MDITSSESRQILTRGARPNELDAVRDVLARAFAGPGEALLWDHLIANDPAFQPERVFVAVLDDRPVACTVLLPREINMPRGAVQGAIITLVGCLPEHQRKGFGGATVRAALKYMFQNDLDIGVLYGHSTYYPRFGFALVMPRTSVSVAAGDCIGAYPSTARETTLRPATNQDHAWMTDLANRQLSYPCSVRRTTDHWSWQPRDESRLRVMALADCTGYACIGTVSSPGAANQQEQTLVVHEAACEPGAHQELLSGLAQTAKLEGAPTIRMVLPPDHVLSRLACIRGAEIVRRPAGGGMAAVTRWSGVLPADYSVADGDRKSTRLNSSH